MALLPTKVITDRPSDLSAPPDRLLLCLHGHGATEHDVTALAPLVDPDGRYLVAGIRGPVPVHDGVDRDRDEGTSDEAGDTEGAGAAWFTSGPRGPDAESVTAAVAAVRATAADLCRRHRLRPDSTVLMGFSQGAATALAVALAPGAGDHPPPPAGVLCMAGFLVEGPDIDQDWPKATTTAVLVQHGDRDEMVPVELGHGTAAALEHHGVPVTWRRYPMAHQVTVESLTDARQWLDEVRHDRRPAAPVGD